jgi:kynurenine formamidase
MLSTLLLFSIPLGCAAPPPATGSAAAPRPDTTARRAWEKGKGWGWVWGKDDEVGALNAMTPETVLAAIQLVKKGKVYDLGILYDRNSYKWPGHSPGEIVSFRTPEGVKRQGDHEFVKKGNAVGTGWHSACLFLNDNVATQIDALCHITEGDDDHWYNGYTEKEWGGNFGPRKCGAETIPPIITRGVMIDVAGYKGVSALPANYPITVEDLQGALKKQGVALRVGDTVLIRTGTLRHWGETGADHKTIGEHDSAGLTLAGAKWLVEEMGAIMIGSDTSGLEVGPAEKATPNPTSFVPVHNYLLIHQGVHIAEFHNLEDLAKDGVYEFLYVCCVNKIKGTAAGFCLRPIAVR